jgi:hypothetical protein
MIPRHPDDRFGSKGDVAAFSGHFCFALESGHPCAFMSTRPKPTAAAITANPSHAAYDLPLNKGVEKFRIFK